MLIDDDRKKMNCVLLLSGPSSMTRAKFAADEVVGGINKKVHRIVEAVFANLRLNISLDAARGGLLAYWCIHRKYLSTKVYQPFENETIAQLHSHRSMHTRQTI